MQIKRYFFAFENQILANCRPAVGSFSNTLNEVNEKNCRPQNFLEFLHIDHQILENFNFVNIFGIKKLQLRYQNEFAYFEYFFYLKDPVGLFIPLSSARDDLTDHWMSTLAKQLRQRRSVMASKM